VKIGEALGAGQPLRKALRHAYRAMPKIAVDYAILEKADNVVVFPATFDWDDVGSWTAVSRHSAKDAAGNVIRGRAIIEEGSDNIVITHDGHFTAVFGADHLIVVHTPDATLVCTREEAGRLKDLLRRLQSDPHARRLL
jgi:mannose-1-phosphate guanylyltransferase